MFDHLTERLARAIKTLRGEARLTESNIQDALREVRVALLEADVALPVVKTFIERVRDIVSLYLAPPERALVLCVDEKPQIQAAQGTAPAFPSARAKPSGAPTTTAVTARLICSPRSM